MPGTPMMHGQEHGSGERRRRRAGSSSGRLCEGRPTDHYTPLSELLRGVSSTRERNTKDERAAAEEDHADHGTLEIRPPTCAPTPYLTLDV